MGLEMILVMGTGIKNGTRSTKLGLGIGPGIRDRAQEWDKEQEYGNGTGNMERANVERIWDGD